MAVDFYRLVGNINALPGKYANAVTMAIDNPPSDLKENFAPAPSLFCPITCLVVGALIMIGGLFILLAANQLLPAGQNLISQIGMVGKAIAYGSFALGTIVGIAGLVHLVISSSKRAFWENTVQHNEIERFVFESMRTNEIFVVDDQLREELVIYYPGNNREMLHDIIPYSSDPRQNYLDFVEKNDLKDKQLVSVNTLKLRVQ